MLKFAKFLFVFILVICSLNFFNLQSLKGSFGKYLLFGYLFVAILISLPYLLPKGKGFIFPVQLICFSILFSVIISWLTWGQSLADCITGSIPILIWVFFFYLHHVKFPIEKIEKIILFYGMVYLVLYFFQFTHPNSNYFIDSDVIDESRGIARIIFPGNGVFYLSVFIALNKITMVKKDRLLWLFILLMGLVVTVMQVTRQIIMITVVIYLFHFLKKQHPIKKILVIGAVFALIIYIFQSDNPIVKGLIGTQKDNLQEGSNYVRVQAATFFMTDFSYSNINRIFGNGVPYGKTSAFNKYTDLYRNYYGFYLSDVGLVAIYAMFGIFAVLGYLLIWLKSFTIKLPEQYHYLKYYLWFLLFTCLTSDTSFGASNLIVTVLVLYSYQSIYEEEKEAEEEEEEFNSSLSATQNQLL